jgi:hypothetical protein
MENEKFVSLLQHGSGAKKQTWTLPLPILVGRDGRNHIVLNHAHISRYHARLIWQEGTVMVEDRQSKNGIRVNGAKVAVAYLHSKDVIQFGPFAFQFFSEPLATNLALVRCSNSECQRVLPRTLSDCIWCGYSLANALTIPSLPAHSDANR